MSAIKWKMPTPTEYKGTLFRSKTEAIYARAFDIIGWKWEYEPYVPMWGHNPDFLISANAASDGRLRLVVMEVKPSKPTSTYLKSILHAATHYNEGFRCRSQIIYGNPWDGGDVMVMKIEDGKWSAPAKIDWMMEVLIEAKEYRFDLENPSLP